MLVIRILISLKIFLLCLTEKKMDYHDSHLVTLSSVNLVIYRIA